jgi:heme-degrading monooxygenase HmoA
MRFAHAQTACSDRPGAAEKNVQQTRNQAQPVVFSLTALRQHASGEDFTMMIGRVWHGWTTHANAEAFEAYMRNEEWPAIFARNIKGLRDIECLRLVRPGHTEFKTVMRFDSMDAVREFAGDDYGKAVLPPRARELLRRYDARAEHFEIREVRSAEEPVAVQSPAPAKTRLARTHQSA